MIDRALVLPPRPNQSFFLWGPRQTGKSTLLAATYPTARRIDLLTSREFVRYVRDPSRLREELAASGDRFVIIDEIQKIPALLDEVHWLIENRGIVFALCGSSARKLRRGHANLLGGRALRYELHGLVATELGRRFELRRALNHGYLPSHYLDPEPYDRIRAYVEDYLKEEVAAEGLTRNLPAFADFLQAAALGDGQLVSYESLARDCGVSAFSAKAYLQILVDTLLGYYLPAYRKRPKRRVIQTPKFYFADVGVVNYLAKRRGIDAGSAQFGAAFENWIFHELCAYRAYHGARYDLAYWRLASGIEVDFVTDDLSLAVEAKATARVQSDHLKGLRALAVDQPHVGARIVVALEPCPRRTDDGIDILPAEDFVQRLWRGELVG